MKTAFAIGIVGALIWGGEAGAAPCVTVADIAENNPAPAKLAPLSHEMLVSVIEYAQSLSQSPPPGLVARMATGVLGTPSPTSPVIYVFFMDAEGCLLGNYVTAKQLFFPLPTNDCMAWRARCPAHDGSMKL